MAEVGAQSMLEQKRVKVEVETLLRTHQYRGSYRMWCTCAMVPPVERHERRAGAINIAALHRAHLADLISALLDPTVGGSDG